MSSCPPNTLQQADGSCLRDDADEEAEDESTENAETDAFRHGFAADASPKLEAQLKQILAHKKHEFCNDLRHELGPAETEACGIPDTVARCPALRAACDRQKPESPKLEFKSSAAEAIARIIAKAAEIFFWGITAFGIIFVIYSLVQSLRARSRDTATPHEEQHLPVEQAQILAPNSLALADELLARARQLASQNLYAEAIKCCYFALLSHLQKLGSLQLHPSATNGDYLRQLAPGSSAFVEVRDSARLVEALEFGGRKASAETFAACFARVGRLISGLSALALCAFLASCNAEPSNTVLFRGCGTGATGYSVMCGLISQHGSQLRQRFRRVHEIDKDVGRIIVLENTLEPKEWETLHNWVRSGGALVLAKPFTPAQVAAGWKREGEPCVSAPFVYRDQAPPLRLALSKIKTLNSTSQQAWTHIGCSEGAVIGGNVYEDGMLITLADESLLNNASFAAADNAAILLPLLSVPGTTVEVIGDWTGKGSDSPLASLSRAGFLPWLVDLLLLALAHALYKGSAFGPRGAPKLRLRRSFAEHAQALGARYAKAQASQMAIAAYGAWAIEQLRERVKGQGRLTELAQRIAERTQRSETQVMTLLVQARVADDAKSDGLSKPEHLGTIRALSALLDELSTRRKTQTNPVTPR